jgi:hypothetical protein
VIGASPTEPLLAPAEPLLALPEFATP